MRTISVVVLAAATTLGLAKPGAAQSMKDMDMNRPAAQITAPDKPKVVQHRKPAKTKRRTTSRSARPLSAAVRPATDATGHQGMQGMDHGAMHGMDEPGQKSSGPALNAIPDRRDMPGMRMDDGPHGDHDMAAMPGMDGPPAGDAADAATALPAGNAPPPPVPTDHAADRVYGSGAMAAGRDHFQNMHGGQNFNQVLLNLGEYQFRRGRDGYRWDGEAWFGGDIDRLWIKSEGEGAVGKALDGAEVQALYSHAIGPYFNLQAGVRHDFLPTPARTYATLGFEGLAPMNFEVEGAAFVSTKGDVLGRLEGYYDLYLTERLILQPRAELNFAAQNVPENRIGSGLSNAELGLRLRYEVRREIAPYIGVSWDRKAGNTTRFARAVGDDVTRRSIVAGIRVWF